MLVVALCRYSQASTTSIASNLLIMLISIVLFVVLNINEPKILNAIRPRFRNFDFMLAKFIFIIFAVILFSAGLIYAYVTLPEINNADILPSAQFVFYFSGASAGIFYANFIWPMVHDYMSPNCGLIANRLTQKERAARN